MAEQPPLAKQELVWFSSLAVNVQRTITKQTLRTFVPAFPSLLDHELVAANWSATAKSLIRSTNPVTDRTAAIDNAIVSLLRDVQVVFTDRGPPDAPVKREKHADLIREFYKVSSSPNTQRDRVFDEWRRAVVLYAIPEYGLSFELCQVIIDGRCS